MPRLVVLGTGTGVGKTYVTAALASALGAAGQAVVQAVKPIETGLRSTRAGGPPARSDAKLLEDASNGPRLRPHPLYAFPRPVSAHLEARRLRRAVSVARIRRWLNGTDTTSHVIWQIVETAGGAFSPISARRTNADLAVALSPECVILVAPDSLGVLHDVRATLTALATLARLPDYVVLSQARVPDASTGSNARELVRLGLPRPIAVVPRTGSAVRALTPLVRALLRGA